MRDLVPRYLHANQNIVYFRDLRKTFSLLDTPFFDSAFLCVVDTSKFYSAGTFMENVSKSVDPILSDPFLSLSSLLFV